jgi:hypothetical protein
MEKKKLNMILIIAVIAIWGILIYKFLVPYFSDHNTEIIETVVYEIPSVQIKTRDTITLNFPRRDPFLGKTIRPVVKNTTRNIKVNKRKTNRSTPTLWPKIEYLGFVKSNSNKNPLGLIRIDGKLFKLKSKNSICIIK